MKFLSSQKDIAEALNFGKYPVLKIDLSKCDGCGLIGSQCRIDIGVSPKGDRILQASTLRASISTKEIYFMPETCGITSDYEYFDFVNSVNAASSPIAKPNSQIAVAVFDSKARQRYGVCIVDTGNASRHSYPCMTCPNSDMSEFIEIAHLRYKRFYL